MAARPNPRIRPMASLAQLRRSQRNINLRSMTPQVGGSRVDTKHVSSVMFPRLLKVREANKATQYNGIVSDEDEARSGQFLACDDNDNDIDYVDRPHTKRTLMEPCGTSGVVAKAGTASKQRGHSLGRGSKSLNRKIVGVAKRSSQGDKQRHTTHDCRNTHAAYSNKGRKRKPGKNPTKVGAFLCAGCPTKCRRAKDLDRHLRFSTSCPASTHEGFPCLCCARVLSRKDALKRHIEKKHGESVDMDGNMDDEDVTDDDAYVSRDEVDSGDEDDYLSDGDRVRSRSFP